MITTINEFRKILESEDLDRDLVPREILPNWLYHISAAKNKESILNNGIKRSTGGGTWFGRTYSNRVYLATSLIAAYDLQLNFTSHGLADSYIIFKVDESKIPNKADFYNDSLFVHGVYTEQDIPKEAIVDQIDPDSLSYAAEDLENLYTTTWMEADLE